MPARATATGSATSPTAADPRPGSGSPSTFPGCGANTSTPARCPTTCSCCTALGRWRSAATSRGACRCSFSQRPSLPARVVLPVPWRPASITTDGGVFANCSGRALPPRISTSSSLTIFTTCCAGFSACETSAPRARSFTAAMNSRTTGSATSASSSAMRISRAVASMSASGSRPLPRSDLKTDSSRSDRVSNMFPPAYGLAPTLRRDETASRLDLDAAPGEHLVDQRPVRRQHPATLELHRRREHLAVREPLLAEEDEPADVLHPREALVDRRHLARDLLLHVRIGGQVVECTTREPHRGCVRVDGKQRHEIRLVVAHRHRLANEGDRLQRRLDVGRRDVLAPGGDDEL